MRAIKWLEKALNIRVQKNQGLLLACSTVTGFLFCYVSAPLQKEVVSKLPAEFLSFQSLWWCFSALLVGVMWKGRLRMAAIRNFAVLAIAESLAAFALAMYLVFIRYNVWVYAVCSLLYSSIVSIFVGKCVMCFESLLWSGRQREDFDNTNSVVRGIVNCLGFGIALLVMPPLKTALFIWGVTCIVDDIGWVVVYRRTRADIVS